MKYNIARTTGEFDSRDAALLTQSLVPLARLYRNVYAIRKNETMSDTARLQLDGVLKDIAECMTRDVLVFTGENPFDIPHE